MESIVIDFQSASALMCLTGRNWLRTSMDPLDTMTRKVLGIMIIALHLEDIPGVDRGYVSEAQVIAADVLLEINELRRYPFLPVPNSRTSRNPAQVLDSAVTGVKDALEILSASQGDRLNMAPLLDVVLSQTCHSQIKSVIESTLKIHAKV